jgi:NADPH2:quinone reductase
MKRVGGHISIARAIGAKVIACASDEEKMNICRRAGAHHVVNYSNPEAMRVEVEKITGGRAAEDLTKPGGVRYKRKR